MSKGKNRPSKADLKRIMKQVQESKPVGTPKKRYSYE